MIKITINEAFRINKKHPSSIIDPLLNIDDARLSRNQEIDDILNYRDLIELVESLSYKYRIVFLMKEVEGYSHKEISQKLDILESSSRSILTRAKAKLQNQLIENLRKESIKTDRYER